MASADIALVCGLNFQMGCQDRLRVNSDADQALANGIAEVSESLKKSFPISSSSWRCIIEASEEVQVSWGRIHE